ncbi:MAG: hypothetical protein JXE07_08660 [Candidatus Aminicenantes bacterium]|nr:hypothetical protein [Candidatus Aminicenantes bacterium]
MKKISLCGLLVAAAIILTAAGAAAQEKADPSKVVGAWTIDVYAGDTTYVLKLVVTVTDGHLEGKISETMGAFADVPLGDLFYDGQSFRFSFVSPTPPDGLARTVKADFKVGMDKMDGAISVPDLEMSVEAKATR